ncbi:MAG TPA: DUF3105 domain-containing protein [Dehalococcoidia bacterium]|nr:DUF3105 domain-containing protein [Dehalococcoidia bacterium]
MTTVAIVLGIGFIVAVLIYAVMQANEGADTGPTAWQKAMLNDDPQLPGLYVAPHPGGDGVVCSELSCTLSMDDREHIGTGVTIPICTPEQLANNQISNPVCYNSNPPTSGPHSANPAQFKVLENPAPKESLIHNMEHGAVVIWYNTDNQDVIKQLEQITKDELDRRSLMVMSKYTEMEPDTIALTAWTRIDKFKSSEFTKKRVQDFIDEHEKRFNPEGF